jgi:hypothetical protein
MCAPYRNFCRPWEERAWFSAPQDPVTGTVLWWNSFSVPPYSVEILAIPGIVEAGGWGPFHHIIPLPVLSWDGILFLSSLMYLCTMVKFWRNLGWLRSISPWDSITGTVLRWNYFFLRALMCRQCRNFEEDPRSLTPKDPSLYCPEMELGAQCWNFGGDWGPCHFHYCAELVFLKNC